MPAYKRLTVREFLSISDSEIIGDLATENAAARFPIPPQQIDAWRNQAGPLREALQELGAVRPDSLAWSLLFEYPIPRIGKRIDAVLLAEDILVVLEFKTGEGTGSGVKQVEDYALNLSYFHEPSHSLAIVPILVGGGGRREEVGDETGRVAKTYVTPFAELGKTLVEVCGNRAVRGAPIDPTAWDTGKFRPTPPIVEAAVALYAGMDVFEIGHACAAHETLERTTAKIIEAVTKAQQGHEKIICFVTGVPGAGKTLVGLNAVHRPELKAEASFLSGNRPLVKVLREALIRDVLRRDEELTRAEATRRVATFVHNVHRFAEEYHEQGAGVPRQHVIVFDEAQRAWNKEQNLARFEREMSEPEMLLEIMERHGDWAVIIALVGAGQEINRGEAGLPEWGRALRQRPKWKVWASSEVLRGGSSVAGTRLFEDPIGHEIKEGAALHLNVSMRALRAEGISDWVNAVMAGDAKGAAEHATILGTTPPITRSLRAAREWLHGHCRGYSRCGLVGSASAMRLRADGLEPSYDFHRFYDWENWFLDGVEDARSSSRLEVLATQFEIQGLELDWVGLCWGEDLVWSGARWVSNRFNNKMWIPRAEDEKHRYRLNGYRVLLTRAREGMIIYVPSPSRQDKTRLADDLDRTVQYLVACGAIEYLENETKVQGS